MSSCPRQLWVVASQEHGELVWSDGGCTLIQAKTELCFLMVLVYTIMLPNKASALHIQPVAARKLQSQLCICMHAPSPAVCIMLILVSFSSELKAFETTQQYSAMLPAHSGPLLKGSLYAIHHQC